MTANPVWLELDPQCLAQSLRTQAVERVNDSGAELLLDFSAILRIDAEAATALVALAGLADQRSVTLKLRSVNVRVYKSLKLLQCVRRFTFL